MVKKKNAATTRERLVAHVLRDRGKLVQVMTWRANSRGNLVPKTRWERVES